LAQFLVSKKFNDLPKETVNAAKGYVLDVIGCTIGASQEEKIKILTEVFTSEGGSPHSSVFGF
jgi:2-methylcitrate dehydratase PrpD